MNNTKYKPAHFPTGTIATFQVGIQEPITDEVLHLRANGVDSYIAVLKNTICPCTDNNQSINISWCTKIVARGKGKVTMAKDPKLDLTLFRTNKHPSNYGTYNVKDLVYNIALDYVKEDSIVDYCQLYAKVVHNFKLGNTWKTPAIINKKKLRSFIKSKLNRFLKRKAVAYREEQAMYQEIYEDSYYD